MMEQMDRAPARQNIEHELATRSANGINADLNRESEQLTHKNTALSQPLA